ncbi:MAG: HAMP domain-containing histidine kinase [Clostridia bacterium]|nr:HAMP domain-containing histidine kinase [Clostridia bacterium]
MVFAVILISLLWIFQTVLLETFYKHVKTRALIDTADVITESLYNADMTDKDALHSIVGKTAVKNDISVKVIDSSSSSANAVFNPVFSVIAQHDNVLSMLRDSELYFIYRDATENGGEWMQHYQRGSYVMFSVPSNGTEMHKDEKDRTEFSPRTSFKHGAPPFFKKGITQELLYAKIVTRTDGKEYMLLFDSVITPIGPTVKTLRMVLIFQSVIILFIAYFSANALANAIAKPITDITGSAKQLAAGNYDVTFDGKGYHEISQLADTLNFATKELRRSDSMKRELISNTSHDLRTPLTMIIGYAEVMRDLPGENTPENVQVIIDEATRLTTLVNDMLDLSKLQSENASLEITEFNITKLSEDIIERISKLTEKDGFKFTFNRSKNAFVKADEAKITQVIYNFISNAVNYSGESRDITVVQSVSSGKVRLEFTDRGIGIPKDQLPSIWDRYYKIDNTHKRSHIGSGIGLSIVKTILEMHKAKYGVISSPSSGSTFWFELDVTDTVDMIE